MTQRITKAEIHAQLEPRFFADYTLFSAGMRHYVAASLEKLFKRDPNDVHRRLYVLGLYKEEYAAYEDMGAILDSFLGWKRGRFEFPVKRVLDYGQGQVRLDRVFDRHGVSSASELYDTLEIGDWPGPSWKSVHPDIDCKVVLPAMCQFMFVDCQRKQKEPGIRAYNKLKHGLAVVPAGNKYLSGLPSAPAVIVNNPDQEGPNPYMLWGIPMTDDLLEQRATAVEFAQTTLRSITGLYVSHRYPEFLAVEFGFAPPDELFNHPFMSTVKDFLVQLSNRERARR